MIYFRVSQELLLLFLSKVLDLLYQTSLRQVAFWLFAGGYFGFCRHSGNPDEPKHCWSIEFQSVINPVGSTTYPVVQGDKAFFLWAAPDSSPQMVCLNLKEGNILWQRTLVDDSVFLPYYNLRTFHDRKKIYLPSGNVLYAIDWLEGNLEHQWLIPGSMVEAVSSDSKGTLFISSNDWLLKKSYVYKVDPERDIMTLFFEFVWPDDHIAFFQAPLALSSGLFLAYTIQSQENRYTYSRWIWIDRSTGRITREGQAYPDNLYGYGPTKQPIACDNDIIMVAYDHIVRLDPLNGTERWRLIMPRDMLTSYPLLDIAQGHLYVALEDGYLYCINVKNGQVRWNSQVSGTPSRIVACDNYVFVVGGGDGLLHWTDRNTGEMMPPIKAPNHDFIRYGHFHRFIGLDCRRHILLLFDGRSVRAYQIPR